MHPNLLKPKDCLTPGFKTRGEAISESNKLTRFNDEQHDVIKIDNLWYVYNCVKHNIIKQ